MNDGVFALTLQIKEPVNLSLHLRASPHGLAFRLEMLREVPEVADILRVRNRERAGLNRLFRHLFIPLVVTEVVAHPDPLKPRIGREHTHRLVIHHRVKREAGNKAPFVE